MVDQAAAKKRTAWRVAGWGTAAGLVLFPLVAMQVGSDVQWSGSDFLFAIMLLGGAGIGAELVAASGSRANTMASAIALFTGLALIWLTGAVGIIGDESEPSNWLFLGIVALVFVGAAVARFRAGGMARVMMAAAAAQMAVAPVATLIGDSRLAAIWAREVVVLTIVFTLLWLAAARLYRRAALEAPGAAG